MIRRHAAAFAASLAALPLLAAPAQADIGENPFRTVSDLAGDGFTPFAVSGAGNASFGMMREAEMYLCFIADRLDTQSRRQAVLLAEIGGDNPDPMVPNIPVLCILTQ